MNTDTLLALLLLTPFFHGVLGLALVGRRLWQHGVSVVGASLYLLLAVLLLIQVITDVPRIIQVAGWARPYGIGLQADLTGALAGCLFGFVNLACVLYAIGESGREHDKLPYFPLFQLLVFGATGAAFTVDLFNLYVWFEVMLVASFVLLAFGKSRERMKASLSYVMINLLSSAFFLISVAILYGTYGTLDMADMGAQIAENPKPQLIRMGWGLMLLFFLIKMAVFPFFAWLPASYPRPPLAVGAFFSGILTKVTFIAMLRVAGFLFPDGLPYARIMLWLGTLTLITGMFAALVQKEGRRAAAWLLTGEMGYLLMVASVWNQQALGASLFMLLHMGLATACLFLCVGLVEQATGQVGMTGHRGLAGKLPSLVWILGLVALVLAGIPPASGFIGKVALLQVLEPLGLAPPLFLLLGSLVSLAALTRMWMFAAWGSGEAPVERGISSCGVAAAVLLLLATLILTVGGEAFLSYCREAAGNLLTTHSGP